MQQRQQQRPATRAEIQHPQWQGGVLRIIGVTLSQRGELGEGDFH